MATNPNAAGSRYLFTGVAVASIWLAVLLVSIFTPQLVIGTDPTRLPVAAMISPIFGVIVTAYICVFVAGLSPREQT